MDHRQWLGPEVIKVSINFFPPIMSKDVYLNYESSNGFSFRDGWLVIVTFPELGFMQILMHAFLLRLKDKKYMVLLEIIKNCSKLLIP